MKKLISLFIVLLAIGALFQACNNSKTYAEMLEEERDAVDGFVSEHNIQTISVSEFEADTITKCKENGYPGENQYVLFPNGVYMQIVERYAVRGGNRYTEKQGYAKLGDAPEFANNNLVLNRFVEVNIVDRDTTVASNVCNKAEYLNTYPDGYRYTVNGTNVYGLFVSEPGLNFFMGYGMGNYGTAVPSGWLMALQYIRDGAHVKLIVPSKSGQALAGKYVYPCFYDMRDITIY